MFVLISEVKTVFCQNCGNQVPDHVAFCPFCGNEMPVEQEPVRKERPAVNKKVIAVFISVVLVVAAAVIVILTLTSRVFVSKYISDAISPEGYDGYAKVSPEDVVDYEAIINELGRAKYNRLGDDLLEDAIDVSFDKSTLLSNGEEITATITIDYKYINSYDFSKKLSGKKSYEKTYVIENLPSAEQVNPFDAIDLVIYDKTEGKCSVQYKNNYQKQYGKYTLRISGENELELVDSLGSVLTTLYVDFSSDNYISTGKITVSVDVDEKSISEKGIVIPEKQTQLAPVECDYLSDGASVSKNDFDALKAIAVRTVNENYPGASYYATYFSFEEVEGYFHDTLKNRVHFVFSYNDYGQKRYVSIYFDNVKLLSTGKIYQIDELEAHDGPNYDYIYDLEIGLAENWRVFYRFAES